MQVEEQEVFEKNGLSEEENAWLSEVLLNTQEQGQMMEQLIKNQIEVKDAMIDKLHTELGFYKNDSSQRYVDQVMKALISIHKNMAKNIESEKWSDISQSDIKREYQYIMEDLTDLLEQQNIDTYTTPVGEKVDVAIHQAKLVATKDSSLDKTIKANISSGYKNTQKVLVPEKVEVYQYRMEEN